jgi:glycosyltransferase involved in cell wall biosynthesis
MATAITKMELDEQLCQRHCMVVHAYYPLGETRVERQAMALLDHGIKVDVICLGKAGEPALETVDGVRVHRMPVRRHKNSGLLVQLFEYLLFFVLSSIHLTKLHRQRRYDIVQVHNLPDFLVFVALVCKLTGARIILDLHDLMPEFYAERFQRSMNSLPVRLIRWQERLSCRFADHIITVTDLWRQALIQRGQPRDKVSVVMNVADDRIFHPGAASGVSQGDDRDGLFRLIYHGTMAQRYGLDLALRAIDLVRREAPDIHIMLHGGGEYRQTLEIMVGELNLQDHVQFSTRFVATDELPRLIERADLGIVPYRDGVFTRDILPTKLMEYAALGIPSIAARTRGIAVHFDETTVQFFTPGNVDELADCILTLYHDRTRLASLARNTVKFSERYNWSNQRENYLRLVERLVDCKSR